MKRSPEISIAKAKEDKLFYVVANVIIVNRANMTCLLLKRSADEIVHGGKWAFPGGKLEHSDVTLLLSDTGTEPLEGIDNILGILAAKEAKEECDLNVNTGRCTIIKNKVFVRPDGVPVFMVTLVADFEGGSVVLNDPAISDFAWVSRSQLDNYDCIEGVREEAATALKT